MSESVLFVDDEPNVLDGIRRQLRKKVVVETATSGEEGLQKVREAGPFAVIVSDMRMPKMNGSEFLRQVRSINPDSVRMILSGQAELQSAIEAVNESHIFRFLTKPCSNESLFSALDAGIEQYRLILAERQLLELTLSGVVEMLTEILGMTNPTAYSRASRIRGYAEDVAATLGLAEEWEFRLATMLSQLGCITVPSDLLARIYSGQDLTEEEKAIYASHPEVARKLLGRIPRLEGVAETISRQMQRVDLETMPEDVQQWDATALGAIVLKAATSLDDLVATGMSIEAAVKKLDEPSECLPPQVTQALRSVKLAKDHVTTKMVNASELEVGMVMDEDMVSANGMRLLPEGQEVTQSILLRLQSISEGVGIAEPFRVKIFQ